MWKETLDGMMGWVAIEKGTNKNFGLAIQGKCANDDKG